MAVAGRESRIVRSQRTRHNELVKEAMNTDNGNKKQRVAMIVHNHPLAAATS